MGYIVMRTDWGGIDKPQTEKQVLYALDRDVAERYINLQKEIYKDSYDTIVGFSLWIKEVRIGGRAV